MCQPSSPPVSFASKAIKLPLVTDLDIGLEDGERAWRAESVRQVLALIQRQEQPNAALLMGGDTEQDRLAGLRTEPWRSNGLPPIRRPGYGRARNGPARP